MVIRKPVLAFIAISSHTSPHYMPLPLMSPPHACVGGTMLGTEIILSSYHHHFSQYYLILLQPVYYDYHEINYDSILWLTKELHTKGGPQISDASP